MREGQSLLPTKHVQALCSRWGGLGWGSGYKHYVIQQWLLQAATPLGQSSGIWHKETPEPSSPAPAARGWAQGRGASSPGDWPVYLSLGH